LGNSSGEGGSKELRGRGESSKNNEVGGGESHMIRASDHAVVCDKWGAGVSLSKVPSGSVGPD